MIDNLSNIILKALERENDVDIFYEKKMCYNNQRLKNAIA